MRRLWLCVLMMPLLLTACSGTGEGNEEERLALQVRSDYLACEHFSGKVAVTADYGQRVYQYEMDFCADGKETVLTLAAPETVAGISARLDSQADSRLEYDGIILETGTLDDSGLTPVSAVPAMLDGLKKGYLDHCVLEERENGTRTLRMLVRDPELEPGRGVETTLWLEVDSFQLLRGEISRDGICVIQCDFSNFTKE